MTQLRFLDTSSSREAKIIQQLSGGGPSGFKTREDVWQSHSCLVSVQSASPLPSSIILKTHDEVFQWIRYLSEMESRGKLSPIVTSAARELWSFLQKREPGIKVPHAGPTEDGGLLMVWDKDRHHFELEIISLGRYEWFYRDRRTDQYEGSEGKASAVGSYSSKLLDIMRLLWPKKETPSEKFEQLVMPGA